MRATLFLCLAAALTACATGYDPQEIEAVRDYVVAAELPKVEKIRPGRSESYTYVNDRYLIMPTRRQAYLVELDRNCPELRETDFGFNRGPIDPTTGLPTAMVDRRTDINVLRARFDTIRGCRISAFYEIDDEQVKELKNLGDAPGEEIFLPDEDK